MADGIELDSGSGGATVKTEYDDTYHWQCVKAAWGSAATQTLVDMDNGLPIQPGTDVTFVLAAGEAAIGKLAANTGVDIGDVDVTSLIPGTDPTSLGKAEDGEHATGDTGVMALSVRQNTAASTSGTDGDYQPLITDTNGRLHVLDANSASIKTAVETVAAAVSTQMQVDIVGSIPAGDSNIGNVDIVSLPAGNLGMKAMAASLSVVPASDITDATYIGDIKFGEALPAGTANIGDVDVLTVVPGVGATNLGKAVNAGFVDAHTGVMALSVRQDTAAALGGTDVDYQPLITDANGRLHVLDANSAAIQTAAEAVETAVETIAAAVSTEMQVDIVAKLPAGDNAIGKLAANSGVDIGDVTVMGTGSDCFVASDGAYGYGVLIQGDDGTDRTAVLVDTDGHVQVDVLSTVGFETTAVLGTGTYAEATTKGCIIGAVRNEDQHSLISADDEIGPVAVTSKGAVYGRVDGMAAEDDAVVGNPVLVAGRYDASEPGLDENDVGTLAMTIEALLKTSNVDNADKILYGGELRTIVRAGFGGNTSGDNQLVEVTTAHKVLVLSLAVFAHGAINVYFKSQDDTVIWGDSTHKIPLKNDGTDGDYKLILPYNPKGWMITPTENDDLEMNSDAEISFSGGLTYILVD